MKKIISLILAVIAVVGLTIPAFASYYPPVDKIVYVNSEGAACSKDTPGAEPTYIIYGMAYPTKAIGYSEELWSSFNENKQKEKCAKAIASSLEYVYPNLSIGILNEEEARYDMEREVSFERCFIKIPANDLLNYDKVNAEISKYAEKYTAENGYKIIEEHNVWGYKKPYYASIVIIKIGEFTTSDNSSSTGSNNKSDNNFASIFTAIINALKNFFNSIFSIFKK